MHRGRERRGLTLAEGVRLVEEAIAAEVAIRHVIAAPELEGTPRGRDLQASIAALGLPLIRTDEKTFRTLAATEHPQGVLAVIEPPRWGLDQITPAARAPVLVLDAVQDPGNVGTMIRTAFGLGAAGVLALPGTAELGNPKAVRAGMGGWFRIPCVGIGETEFRDWCSGRGMRVMITEPGAPLPRAADRPVALVVGNEGAGTRPALAAWISERAGIPLRPGADSLNVAVAAGILLHEVIRE